MSGDRSFEVQAGDPLRTTETHQDGLCMGASCHSHVSRIIKGMSTE